MSCVSWREGADAPVRSGIVTTPKKIGKAIQLTISTDDGWLVYRIAEFVDEVTE
jgi:hypothetical protein